MGTFADTANVDLRLSFASGKINFLFNLSSHFKRKTEAQAIFLNPFAHRENGSLSLAVHLFKKKQTEIIRFQTD
jgi:hypothetical protein